MVVEDFGTGAAGTRVGHLPEIVGGVAGTLVVANADDPLGGDPDLVLPDVVSLVVFKIDGDPELVFRQPVNIGQQGPGKADRVMLEIIAEAEVAEHFEECMVTRGVADVFKVVVLSARTHAALRRCRALVRAGVLAREYVLELHHPGIGKEQRRVVRRDKRGRRNDRVTLGLEVLQEFFADLGRFHRLATNLE